MINRDVAVKLLKESGDATRVMGDVVMDANERLEEYLTSVMEFIAAHCEGLEDGAVIEVDDGEKQVFAFDPSALKSVLSCLGPVLL